MTIAIVLLAWLVCAGVFRLLGATIIEVMMISVISLAFMYGVLSSYSSAKKSVETRELWETAIRLEMNEKNADRQKY